MRRTCLLAIALSTLVACAPKGGALRSPAWVDPRPCQAELPEPVAYQEGAPLGDKGDVVVVVREGKEVTAYVVRPATGEVPQAVRIDPAGSGVVNPLSDAIVGGIVTPPRQPPPPPTGEDRLKYVVGLASRVTMTAPSSCAAGGRNAIQLQ